MKSTKLALRLLAVTACLAMQGCANPTYRIGGYLWRADPESPVCQQVVWRQVDRARVPGLCMDMQGRAAPEGYSCALGCVVISQYSESDARRRMIFGESLYDHEARHVLEGLVHPRENDTRDSGRATDS